MYTTMQTECANHAFTSLSGVWIALCRNQNYEEKQKEQSPHSLQLTLALNRTQLEPASVSWQIRRGESVYSFFGIAIVYDCCIAHGIRACKPEIASNGHRIRNTTKVKDRAPRQ